MVVNFYMEFSYIFSKVESLVFILYYFWMKALLNLWPRNVFLQSYTIIVILGYLHRHDWYTRLYNLYVYVYFYCNISNYPVTGSIMVKYFSIRGPSWPSCMILYGPIRSTNNLSEDMASASFVGKWSFFASFFLTI